jgi:GNAT superfamily N-acetyltransferase
MVSGLTGFPAGLALTLDTAPTPEVRGALGQAINAFHARTVPPDTRRFALLLHDGSGELAAGISAVLAWQWMFVEALWVGDAWRRHGVGRGLLLQAEARAVADGCHSGWLDTFQARDFYAGLGYAPFGTLADYPPGQSRSFMSKRLSVAADRPA